MVGGIEAKVNVVMCEARHYRDMRRIWHEALGDAYGYIDFFFANKLGQARAFVAEAGARAVGAMYLLPASVEISGREEPAWVLYALAVDEKWRSRGIGVRLVDAAKRLSESQGALLLCAPANAALVQFYRNRGFSEAIWERVLTVQGGEQTNISFEKCEPREYKALRDARFAGEGYVKWNLEAVGYAIAENEYCSGECLAFSIGDVRMAALVEKRGECVLIKELVAPRREETIAIRAITGRYHADFAIAHLQAKGESGQLRAMAYNKPLQGGYYNLPLN